MQFCKFTLSAERNPYGEYGVKEKNNPSFCSLFLASSRLIKLARISAGAVVFRLSANAGLLIFSYSHFGHSFSIYSG